MDRDLKGLPAFVFVKNKKILNTIGTEEIGTLQIVEQTKASQSVAEGKGLEEGIVNREAQLVLTTRNVEGRQCYNEHDHVTVEIKDERGRECATEVRINDNKDGLYQTSSSPRDEGRCKLTVKVNGEHVHGSPFTVQVKPFKFRPVTCFGKRGSSVGMFILPQGVAINARDHIV